jgi:hypothetical protein
MKDRKSSRPPQMPPQEYLPEIEVEKIVVQPISRASFENPLTKEISGRISWVWRCNGSAQTLIVAIDELMNVLGTHDRIKP